MARPARVRSAASQTGADTQPVESDRGRSWPASGSNEATCPASGGLRLSRPFPLGVVGMRRLLGFLGCAAPAIRSNNSS
jgi:hypothetical protein